MNRQTTQAKFVSDECDSHLANASHNKFKTVDAFGFDSVTEANHNDARRRSLPMFAAVVSPSVVLALLYALLSVVGDAISPIIRAALCVVALAAAAWATRGVLERYQTATTRQLADAASEQAALRSRFDDLVKIEAARRTLQMNRMAETIERDLIGELGGLTEHSRRMQEISDSIAAGAARSGENAVMSGEAADLSVESARRLAHTTDALNTAIHQISRQIDHAMEVTTTAVAATDDAKHVIESLTNQVTSIQSVVDLIRMIAEQTNLLALNATIEAARAGEAGRGFAVVASEVKGLARKTAQSTESIAETIAAIHAANGQATGAIDRIGEAVSEIDRVAAAIATAVAEQRTVTGEIAASVKDTVEAASSLSERITQLTAEVSTSFENAADVHNSASSMSDAATTMIDTFKSVIVRAVRTSAPEVNRRDSPRRAVDAACVLDLRGFGRFSGRTFDISDSGARVIVPSNGAAPPPPGTEGALEMDGLEPRRLVRMVRIVSAQAEDAAWTIGLRFADRDAAAPAA
jgi:methyl-accepting chemotaxis protein